jgi:hypothetical protein
VLGETAAAHGRAQTLHQRDQTPLRQLRNPQRLSFAGVVAMAALTAGVQVDVRKQPVTRARAERQKLRDQVERHTIEEAAEELAQSGVAVRHERERAEEMLAELSIGDPWSTVVVRRERQRVDEHRTCSDELDVVGRGILQDHAEGETEELNVEREERRVLQLAEAPLVRIGDVRHRLRLQDPVRLG